MFTVKVREERTSIVEDQTTDTQVNETIFEAKQVMLSGKRVYVDLVEGSLMGVGQIIYETNPPKAGYVGKMYVMNRYGATVATYDL